MLLDDVIRKL